MVDRLEENALRWLGQRDRRPPFAPLQEPFSAGKVEPPLELASAVAIDAPGLKDRPDIRLEVRDAIDRRRTVRDNRRRPGQAEAGRERTEEESSLHDVAPGRRLAIDPAGVTRPMIRGAPGRVESFDSRGSMSISLDPEIVI